MPIKTFRGLMTDDTQDTIVLHTNDGSTGYRIVKFQIIGPDSNENIESTLKVYKVKQTTIDDKIDFSDNTLLAAATMSGTTSSANTAAQVIVFDNEVFNQDIYVTLKGESYTANMNYYIELEQIKLDLSENTVATLKDIRNLS
jgi:hypothetical protein